MKYTLNEDIFEVPVEISIPQVENELEVEEIIPEGPEPGIEMGISDLILDLINQENTSIQAYNSFSANIDELVCKEDFETIINEITNDKMKHVGMLQAMLEKVSPNAEVIAQGKEEATQELSEALIMESKEIPYFKAYITNLGKYNEGELVGEWVEFPIDEDDFKKILEKIEIGPQYEEWFVTDYETNLPGFNWQDLGEYPSYDALQEFGELLDGVNDLKAIGNAYEVTGDLKEAIDGIGRDTIIFYDGIYNYSELADAIIDEFGGLEELGKDTLERYFDYEQLGRELNFDSYESEDEDGNEIEVSAGEYFCGDENATDYEIGEAFVNDIGYPQDSTNYFDYEQFGRDLSFDGYTFTSDGVIYME